MNDCSIGSQKHNRISRYGVTSTNLFESLLDSISIQSDHKKFFAFSTDYTTIDYSIEWTSVVPVLHDRLESGQLKYHFPSC